MGIATIKINLESGMQTIDIPQDMKIDDDSVYLKKIGNALYIIPFHSPWQNLIESTESFTSDFMETKDQQDCQQRESFD